MEDRRQGRHRQHRKSSCRCPSASWRGSARRVHSAWSPGISRVRYERIVFPNLSRADVPRPELFSRVRVSQHPRAVGSRQSGTRIECRPAADRGLAREAHRRTGDPTFSPRGKHRRPVAPEHPGGAGLGRRAVTVSQRCRSSLLAACVYWLAPAFCALWVCLALFLGLNHLGRQPLQLKPFHQERGLGLATCPKPSCRGVRPF